MRYIVVFLVIFNVAYLGWSYFSAPPEPQQPPDPARPLLNTGLMLVSEYQAEQENFR
ncbi:MAG: hypothetical protein ACR2PR_01185 [Pseudohongiellaceae bacterium]